jgi:hypothetical protein
MERIPESFFDTERREQLAAACRELLQVAPDVILSHLDAPSTLVNLGPRRSKKEGLDWAASFARGTSPSPFGPLFADPPRQLVDTERELGATVLADCVVWEWTISPKANMYGSMPSEADWVLLKALIAKIAPRVTKLLTYVPA